MPQRQTERKTSATNSSEILRIFFMRLTWDLFISQICENGKMAKSEKHSETLTKIIYLLLLFAPNSCRGNGKFQFKNFLCGLWSWSPEQLIKVCTRWNVPPTTRPPDHPTDCWVCPPTHVKFTGSAAAILWCCVYVIWEQANSLAVRVFDVALISNLHRH